MLWSVSCVLEKVDPIKKIKEETLLIPHAVSETKVLKAVREQMLRPKCQNSARTTIFKFFTAIFFNLNKIVEKFSLVREHLDLKNLNFVQ